MSSWENKRILLACHDSGGAEIVSAWAKKHPLNHYAFLLEGPALKVFGRKFANLRNFSRKEIFPKSLNFDFVLTGTGWESDLEREAINWAKKSRIRVASFLDHWHDYQVRFQSGADRILPDEIWVGDEFAFKQAESDFPDVPIQLVENPYFEEIKEEYAKQKLFPRISSEKKRILFICEPREAVSIKKFGHPNFWGYNEFEAMENYLNFLKKSGEKVEKILVRLHPSEASGKYRKIIALFASEFDISEAPSRPLVEDCAWADWVVGCDSIAMVVALLVGKTVFSCIPSKGKPLTLPFSQIIKLFNE